MRRKRNKKNRNARIKASADNKTSEAQTSEADAPKAQAQDQTAEAPTPDRRRQASVAAILDGTLKPLAECSPELWDRRAYLMLVGLVYEKLATNEMGIATDELVALAKILAEIRRTETRTPHTRNERTDSTDPKKGKDGKERSRELPGEFAQTIREIYGTNYQPPDPK